MPLHIIHNYCAIRRQSHDPPQFLYGNFPAQRLIRLESILYVYNIRLVCATTPEWAATLLVALQRSLQSVDSAVIQLLAAQMGARHSSVLLLSRRGMFFISPCSTLIYNLANKSPRDQRLVRFAHKTTDVDTI